MKSMKGHKEAQKSRDRSCCGVIEEAAETAREKRMNRTTAQPWIVRKLMVGITAGIMGYTAYVYIRLLCLPMVWQRNGAPASRGTGVALLVVFCVLYFWMVWAYIRVVITSPGYAHDHVQKSDRPLMPMDPTRTSSWRSNTILSSNSGPHDVESGNRDPQQRSRSFSASTTQRQSSSSPYGPSQQKSENGLASFSYEDLLRRDGIAPPQDPNTGTLDSIKPPKPSLIQDSRPPPTSNTLPEPSLSHPPPSAASHAPLSRHQLPASLLKKTKPALPRLSSATTSAKHNRNAEREAQRANLRRWPPTTPVLLPAHRYCAVDEIVKPYRAHHCRACGTCVLKYDHHCPWIGQCVGARNHKFFINFCQAAAVLTGYVFGTLLAYTITSTNTSPIDPQHIVIIALAALFLLFTFMLSISHVHLTLQGQTTVESMQIRTMKQREERVLADGFSWWQFGAKRRKQKEWDYEWGRLNKEGNIWWRGNKYDEWIDVMGKNWLGWILPIGRVERNKGLDYPVNARFNADGRWRRRSEWPESFR